MTITELLIEILQHNDKLPKKIRIECTLTTIVSEWNEEASAVAGTEIEREKIIKKSDLKRQNLQPT